MIQHKLMHEQGTSCNPFFINCLLHYIIGSTASDEDIDSTQMLLASFGPNDITSVVNVSIVDDNIVEDQEIFQLLLVVPSPAENIGITAGSPHVANAVILDNDGNV